MDDRSLFSELSERFLGEGIVDEDAFKTRLAARLMERRVETMVKHAMGAVNPNPHTNHIEGIGQAMLEIDPDEMLFWETRLPGCWFDSEFRKEYARDNPAARAIYHKMRTTIVV